MTRRWNVVLTSTVVLLALLLACVAVLANGNARPQEAAAATAAAGQSQAGGGRGTSAGPPVSTARFTLEFVNAEIIDVLQALATQSGANIAASGSVRGTTTLRLRDVTLEQALNIVTRLNGLDYAWVDAAYVVGTPEEVNAMRVADLRTSVVALQHIQPSYARDILGSGASHGWKLLRPGTKDVFEINKEYAFKEKIEIFLFNHSFSPIVGGAHVELEVD